MDRASLHAAVLALGLLLSCGQEPKAPPAEAAGTAAGTEKVEPVKIGPSQEDLARRAVLDSLVEASAETPPPIVGTGSRWAILSTSILSICISSPPRSSSTPLANSLSESLRPSTIKSAYAGAFDGS